MSTDAEAAAKLQAQIEGLKKATACFDTEALPVPAQIIGVLKALGQEVDEKAAQGMIDYVKQERDQKNLVFASDAAQCKMVEEKSDASSAVMTSLAPFDMATAAHSIAQLWKDSCKKFADNKFIGSRAADATEYSWQTFSQANDSVLDIGSGLGAACGLSKGSKVGINLSTQARWTLAHYSNALYGRTTVTLYDTLGAEAIEYILKETELTTVICTPEGCVTFCSLAKQAPHLKHLVVVGEVSDELTKAGADAGITVHSFDALSAKGKEARIELPEVKPEDELLICYTSGTTGMPKGVLHTQETLALSAATASGLDFRVGDVHIAFLPLAHIMELYLEACCLVGGVAMGFSSVPTLMADLQVLKPTLLVAVPRLLNKIYDKVMAGARANTGIKAALGGMAVASKKKLLHEKGYHRSFWDFIVFSKVKPVLGGRVRYIATGSAPISPEVLDFYRIFFGAQVREGYGMSEVCPTHFTDATDVNGAGTVGPPIFPSETKLVDVPDMNYFSTDKPHPRGEICFRGPHVMKGYYKQAEKTAETIDKEGWLHSGDIGKILPNGVLQIFDRKKNIFKLSQGEYVAPDKCENVFAKSKFVAQSFTYGDSLKSELVTVVVPDPDVLPGWATAQGIEGDMASLVASKKVSDAILADIDAVGRANGLKGFEIPKAITLTAEGFTPQNGVLTPSMKLKRPAAKAKYQADIDRMYAERQAYFDSKK